MVPGEGSGRTRLVQGQRALRQVRALTTHTLVSSQVPSFHAPMRLQPRIALKRKRPIPSRTARARLDASGAPVYAGRERRFSASPRSVPMKNLLTLACLLLATSLPVAAAANEPD